ncbi:hypothetical protein [Pararhodobacter sp. CCB-MM2]|nr:hypothetical protein [Pararhodobacter sp. CCB-MM2]
MKKFANTALAKPAAYFTSPIPALASDEYHIMVTDPSNTGV